MPSCFSRICQENLRPSSYMAQKYDSSFVAPTKKGQKKEILVKVMNSNGQMVPIKAIFDTGNDLSILTAQTARQLGLYHPNRGEAIHVSGIYGGGQEFRMFPNWIQLGNMRPMKIKMGFAVNSESLPVNLIGNKDILDSGNFTVMMDEDTIAIHEKMPMANIDMRYGGGNMNAPRTDFYRRRGIF